MTDKYEQTRDLARFVFIEFKVSKDLTGRHRETTDGSQPIDRIHGLIRHAVSESRKIDSARIAELEAAEEGAKQAFGDVVQQKRDLEAEVDRLRGLLEGAHAIIRDKSREAAEAQALVAEAAEDIASWGAYAGEYFQQKHGLTGAIAKYREAKASALTAAIEQARSDDRAKIIAQLGDMADNARDNGYPLAAEALQEAIDLLDATCGTDKSAGKCETCNGHGMVGGPSYYAPDEGGEPCPDCSPREGGA